MRHLFLILLVCFTIDACKKAPDKFKNAGDDYPSPTETGTNEIAWKVDSVTFFEKSLSNDACVLQIDTLNKNCTFDIQTTFITEGGNAFALDLSNVQNPLPYPIIEGTVFNIPYANSVALIQNPPGNSNASNDLYFPASEGKITIKHFDPVNHIISGQFEFTTTASGKYPLHAVTDGWFDFVYFSFN